MKFNAAFWKWFGDSKVVDSKGNPLVVYHGTDSKIKKFDIQMCDLGCHFGTESQALDTRRRHIDKYFLSIQRPIRMQDHGIWDVGDELVRVGILGASEHRKRNDYDFYIQKMIESGIDGIVYLNRSEGLTEKHRTEIRQNSDYFWTCSDTKFLKSFPESEDSWIAFLPEQIKSVNNDGTWDADDADIRSNPPEVLFHHSSKSNRASILKHGLSTEFSEAYSKDSGGTGAVFMTDNPNQYGGSDVWAVDVKGLDVELDNQQPDDDSEAWYVYWRDISPKRLALLADNPRRRR